MRECPPQASWRFLRPSLLLTHRVGPTGLAWPHTLPLPEVRCSVLQKCTGETSCLKPSPSPGLSAPHFPVLPVSRGHSALTQRSRDRWGLWDMWVPGARLLRAGQSWPCPCGCEVGQAPPGQREEGCSRECGNDTVWLPGCFAEHLVEDGQACTSVPLPKPAAVRGQGGRETACPGPDAGPPRPTPPGSPEPPAGSLCALRGGPRGAVRFPDLKRESCLSFLMASVDNSV